MRKTQNLLFVIGAMLLLAACSGKMGALDPKYFSVTPNPLRLKAATWKLPSAVHSPKNI